MQSFYDVIIIGTGAAGLMCAIEAGRRGRSVVVLDHAKKTAEKIRISGGGRCNFTNIHTSPANFLSQNPHFCKSALSRFTPSDFMAMLDRHGVTYHEKKLGQMFCDESAQQVIDMLLKECADVGAQVLMETAVEDIHEGYHLKTSRGDMSCESLVIATGGLSIPKIGATNFGYKLAQQFGLNVIETRAGLVPLMFQADILEHCKSLSGLSVEAEVRCADTMFAEGLLFTHRGLSGPSILQISSYWREGEALEVNLAPQVDVQAFLKAYQGKQDVMTVLADIIPKRLAMAICDEMKISGRVAELSGKSIEALAKRINAWSVKPSGTEGYRTAEVTLGGVDTDALSSKTMEAKKQKGLYFIGEVVDVTGHLGGFNFQWAWASGYAAGQVV